MWKYFSSGSQFSSQGQSNLIPAFTGLGLGGRVWPATTATPPPGFSHHRQLPHHHTAAAHYQPGFAGVSKGSEAHKIGGEYLILITFTSLIEYSNQTLPFPFSQYINTD